jgi:uncharacterized protein with HEPN domain
MGVNYLLVWDVMKNKIPEWHQQIIEILGKANHRFCNHP